MRPSPPGGLEEGMDEIRPVIDPTSRLLREVAGEARFPWIPAGIVLLLLLWFASMPQLVKDVAPAELGWMSDAQRPAGAAPGGSELARALTRATWSWQGVEPDLTRPLSNTERIEVRLPAALTGAASLIVFFLLSRLVGGVAAALLAASLLAIAPPWIQAGTSALPLIAGELMVLLGVTWALVLHSRHREVELATVTALRIGVAGAFLGIGLLLAPATFAAFVTTLLLWFVLGLRRSSSEATTLPVESPRRTIVLAVVGTLVLLGATMFVSAFAERLAGGGRGGAPALPPLANLVPEASLWTVLHRKLLSPGPHTDRLLLAALGLIVVVRVMERWAGRPWKAAGLLPWVYLGVHCRIAGHEVAVANGSFVLPVTITPLLVLGLGWIVLRGLQPGRVRRQEYGFAVTWLVASVLLAPFVSGGHPYDPGLAAAVSVLPPALLIAGRGGRSLWESEEGRLGHVAILVIGYWPVARFAAEKLGGWVGPPSFVESGVNAFRDAEPAVLLAAAALGALSVILTVRPDPRIVVREPVPAHGRRGRRGRRAGRGDRGGRHGRGGPRRGHHRHEGGGRG